MVSDPLLIEGAIAAGQDDTGGNALRCAVPVSIASDRLSLWIGEQRKWQAQRFLRLQVHNNGIGGDRQNSADLFTKFAIVLGEGTQQIACFSSSRAAYEEEHQMLALLIVPRTVWHAIRSRELEGRNDLICS